MILVFKYYQVKLFLFIRKSGNCIWYLGTPKIIIAAIFFLFVCVFLHVQHTHTYNEKNLIDLDLTLNEYLEAVI